MLDLLPWLAKSNGDSKYLKITIDFAAFATAVAVAVSVSASLYSVWSEISNPLRDFHQPLIDSV